MTKKSIIPIKGMHCKSCVQKIENGISEMDGIKKIKVNLIKNTAHVEFDSKKTDLGKIKAKIMAMGYSMVGNDNSPVNHQSQRRNILEGIAYGLVPHIGCIGFIVGSIVGVTFLMEFFRPLLMNRWFFHILILISLGFATLASAIYLRKNEMLSFAGAKRKWKYLSTMYGSTVGINLVLFMLIFPLLANVSLAGGVTGNLIDGGASTIRLSVDIPCPGHAPLISNELKTVDGVLVIQFEFPNNFDVQYDSSKTSGEDMLSLEVFDEYPATMISENQPIKEAAPLAAGAATGSCDGSCGGTGSCGLPSCGCAG